MPPRFICSPRTLAMRPSPSPFLQTPFILNETLRGNILLGAPMDEEWYQQVLAACALLPDLKILPGGDMTQASCRSFRPRESPGRTRGPRRTAPGAPVASRRAEYSRLDK